MSESQTITISDSAARRINEVMKTEASGTMLRTIIAGLSGPPTAGIRLKRGR